MASFPGLQNLSSAVTLQNGVQMPVLGLGTCQSPEGPDATALGRDALDTWRGMEALVAAGKTRAIGVSNFQRHPLQMILDAGLTLPAVNQVEFHPKLMQPELHTFLREHGIVSQAWSPLMQGKFGDEPVILRIAEEVGRHPPQVLVRWDLQHGVVTIPKSTKRPHIESNADVFDFELSAEPMHDLNALDQHHRLGPDPDAFGV